MMSAARSSLVTDNTARAVRRRQYGNTIVEVALSERFAWISTGMDRLFQILRNLRWAWSSHEGQERLVHDLGERVKELTTLHAVGRLLNEPGEPAELLRRVVAVLPSGWQYPEISAARISGRGIDVRTDGFRPSAWLQRAQFRICGPGTGVIEVVYLEQRPERAEGPFLAEERNLLDSLARMLAAYFERLAAEDARIRLIRAEAARAEAQEANSAKDLFLATLSHELRAPLNVMLGWTTMLRSSQLSQDRTARGLEVLEQSVRIQARLIEDLLDVSRIITGHLRVDMQTVDASAVANLAVDAARPAADARRVCLEAAISPSLFVRADPARLQQVVSNLLTNALKFTPEGGHVGLSLERRDDNVCILVKDTGIGMPSELLPVIFERFRQGDASTTRRHGGLGLGLAIVKHLVERHGGRVTAESEGPGRGSVFMVNLPLNGEGEGRALLRGSGSLDSSSLAGLRVLVVDDHPDARDTLKAILEQYGARPTAVASVHEALESISTARPDVLLCDLAMPDQDGYSLMLQLRTTLDAKALPAVALSAYADDESRARTFHTGFQAHLVKPAETDVLISTLAGLVHRVTT
jgi:signal transduction histidine kinase